MINIRNEKLLVNLIKKLIDDYDKEPKTIICAVVTPPPALTLKYSDMVIPTSSILINSLLLQTYKRKFTILDGKMNELNISGTEDMTMNPSSQTEIDLIPASTSHTPHMHKITALKTTNTDMKLKLGTFKSAGTINLVDTLLPNDLVEVGVVGDKFIVRHKLINLGGV